MTRDPLELALHYQSMAKQNPKESRFWTARALYYGRRAARGAPRPPDRHWLTGRRQPDNPHGEAAPG
jgi:hypothetical protein